MTTACTCTSSCRSRERWGCLSAGPGCCWADAAAAGEGRCWGNASSIFCHLPAMPSRSVYTRAVTDLELARGTTREGQATPIRDTLGSEYGCARDDKFGLGRCTGCRQFYDALACTGVSPCSGGDACD